MAFRHCEPGGDSPLGHVQDRRDLSVGEAVQMAQYDRARLLWRQCTELANEIRLHGVGRIRISGPPQALQDCPDLEQTLTPALSKGHVQSDPKEPRFGGGILLPCAPGAESAQVSLRVASSAAAGLLRMMTSVAKMRW